MGLKGGDFMFQKGGGYQDRGMKKEGLFSLAWSESQLKKKQKTKKKQNFCFIENALSSNSHHQGRI